MEPSIGIFAVLKVGVPNPVSMKLISSNRGNDNFLGSFVRKENEWYIYIDRFKDLALRDIEKITSEQIRLYDDMFPELDNSKFIVQENKLVRRKIFEISQKFYNGVFEIPGTVISPMAGLNSKYTVIGIKYPRSQSQKVTELIMNYIDNSRIDVSILYLDNEDDMEPFFLKLMKILGIKLNEYVLIKTVWNMDDMNMLHENHGIFQNDMTFEPKICDPDNPGLIATINKEKYKGKVMGNAPFSIVGDFENNYVVEFKLGSKWFKDFYNDIIHPMGGEFYYWGHSNGKGILENYYVIRKDNLSTFMNGLRKHWNEKSRAEHRNMIERVENLDNITI